MNGLKVSKEEAETVYLYDSVVDKDEGCHTRLEYDLPPEKEAIAKKQTHTGTRERKKPTVYKLEARKRKPNATKEGLVSELKSYVEAHSDFDIQFLQVPNPTQKICFKVGDKWYTWTLTEHRTKPKHATEGGD